MNAIYRTITYLDWLTIVLLFGLVLLVLGKYFFKNSFFSFIALPFNSKYLTLNRKKGKMLNGFHLMMSVFQIMNIGLFIYLARNLWSQQDFGTYPELFGIIVLFILCFILLKILLQIGNGFFFENYGLMTDLIFEKLTYFNYGGIVAFIGNIFLIYILQGSKPLIYTIILLLLLINGIGLIKILRNHQKLVVANLFYFILYLCTLEIAPMAIIISFLNS